MRMGSLVNMSRYGFICTCVDVCTDVQTCIIICMNQIVSYMPISAHIALYVLYDYVQRCEDTASVELCYIN